jgi:hypothetical protein
LNRKTGIDSLAACPDHINDKFAPLSQIVRRSPQQISVGISAFEQ